VVSVGRQLRNKGAHGSLGVHGHAEGEAVLYCMHCIKEQAALIPMHLMYILDIRRITNTAQFTRCRSEWASSG
jgi:hypothetical protein